MTRFRVDVEGAGAVSVLCSAAETGPRLRFVYAPGAGSSLNDPFGAYCAEQLPRHGFEVWRFQFPYMEAGRRAPDRAPLLEATWRAVLEAARDDGVTTVAGGRSMGGRIASQVVAGGAPVTALALFAYPLHPPGRPEQRRDMHLASIRVPTLFCSGTRDAFAAPDELRAAAALVPGAVVRRLEGADHGFATLKSSGRDREDVWREAVEALFDFTSEWGDVEPPAPGYVASRYPVCIPAIDIPDSASNNSRTTRPRLRLGPTGFYEHPGRALAAGQSPGRLGHAS